MVRKFKLEAPEPLKNKSGEVIPGKYKLMCYPFDRGSARYEAVQTFESINKFGESTALPQPGTEFIGVQLGEKVYIIKYLSSFSSTTLENTKSNPEFYGVGAPSNPGDWGMRMSPMSYIQFLTSGVLKLRASAETYINLIPDLATFSKLLDRIEMGARNFSLKVYGGAMEWLNYSPNSDKEFVSQLKFLVRRGNPILEMRKKNNHIELKTGSVIGDETGILNFDVAVTDEKTGDTVLHTFRIGSDGINLKTIFPNDSVVHTKDITKTGVVEKTVLTDPDDKSKSQELSAKHSFTESTYTTKIKQNTVTLKITEDGVDMESTKDVVIKGAKSVTVNSPKAFIKGGKFTVEGSVAPTGKGPFNAIPVCPFTGAPHIGNVVSGT